MTIDYMLLPLEREEKSNYIARAKCGCIVMACVDNPDHLKDTAKEVAKAIRQGYIIERATSSFIRGNWLCPKHETEKTKRAVIDRMAGR